MGTPAKDGTNVDLDKVWESEASRAVEVLGGEPVKYTRTVEDKLKLTFTLEEWCKLFNVAEGYIPCGGEWKAYRPTQPIVIYFIREIKE